MVVVVVIVVVVSASVVVVSGSLVVVVVVVGVVVVVVVVIGSVKGRDNTNEGRVFTLTFGEGKNCFYSLLDEKTVVDGCKSVNTFLVNTFWEHSIF